MIRCSLTQRNNLEALAVIDGEQQLTYRELGNKAAAIQQKLMQNKNNHAGIFLPNSADFLAALYGIFTAGMTAFPLNISLTVHEISSLLKDGDVFVVITRSEYRRIFEEIPEIRILYIDEIPAESEKWPKSVETDENSPMLMLSTSGTTGKSKLVQLSEKNSSLCALEFINKMDFEKFAGQELRLAVGTPYSCAYGILVLTAYILKSIPIVVLKEKFTVDTLFKEAQKHRITHFEGGVSVGLMMEQMAGRPNPYDISSFKYFGLAGSGISGNVLKSLSRAYPGVEFWTGYGLTEAGPLIAKPCKHFNPEKFNSAGTKISCITLMLNVDGVLTDSPFIIGEIVVKGPTVMLGYYKNEAETSKIIRDGFLYTGDMGYLDGEGYLYICGRKKNIIIVRGFNVYPEEVEDCLINSGLIKDCVVYGEKDSQGNEIVCAEIVPFTPEISEENIREYFSNYLAEYKWPKIIRIVDSVKKTSTGKTERA